MGKAITALGNVLKTETPVTKFIPYTCHVDENTVKTRNGDFVQVIEMEGIGYDTVDTEEICARLETRNAVYRNITRPSLAIWTTLVRRTINSYPAGTFPTGFAADLDDRYRSKIKTEKLFVNRFYFALIERSTSGALGFGSFFRKDEREAAKEKSRAAIKNVTETTNIIVKSFKSYGAKRLGLYRRKGILHSEVLEFLASIINGVSKPVPLPRECIANALCTSRVSFGIDALELRKTDGVKIGGILGLKEYCAVTTSSIFDQLLGLPFEFVLTQSFTFVQKSAAVSKMTVHRDRMVQAGDLAESQIRDIESALDDLTSGRFVMGSHHFVFVAYGDSVPAMQDNLAVAGTVISDAGFVTAREDLAMEAAFWSQFPANFSYQPRAALVTSRNFAGLVSFHNPPAGKKGNSCWGAPVSMFRTTAGTPYFFHIHPGGGATPLGNMTVIGPSGAGKTVFLGFLLAQSEKYRARVVFFDKDRGAEIFIRAQEGLYTSIKEGVPTGFNPLQLDPTPRNRAFWGAWLKLLAQSDGTNYSSNDAEEIDEALTGILALPPESRNLSGLIPFLDMTRHDGVAKRLKRWTRDAENGWVFDNDNDRLDLGNRLSGFDITEFLDNPTIRTPLLLYLFHRIEALLNGTRTMIYIDEGWKAVDDEVFALVIKNWLKTVRKRNGLLVFATQSAQDAAECSISDSIIEQTATNIFMPNSKAREAHYIDSFGLSAREYEIVRSLPERSRRFLIRQGQVSVVAELDLTGMDDDINVLSGTERNVAILDQIRREKGEKPGHWLSAFLERVRQ